MSRRLFLVLFSFFIFLLPLKFGNPIVLESLSAWPQSLQLPGLMQPISILERIVSNPWLSSLWPNQLAILGAFALLVMGVWANREALVILGSAFWLPCAFLATQLAAMPRSVTPQVSLDTVLMFAAGLALYVIGLCFFHDQRDVWRTCAALLAATGIVAFITIEQYFGGLEDTRKFFHLYFADQDIHPDYLIKIGGDRPFGTFVYSNSLAGFLVLVFPILIALLWRLRVTWEHSAVWLAIAVVGGLVLFSLVLSGSKGGFLTLAGVVVAGVFLVQLPTRIKWALLIVVMLCGVGLFARYGPKLASYGLGTATARVNYWKAGVRIFADHPILGSGPGTFGSIYPKYKVPTSEDPRLAHNNFLQSLSDSGLPGFVAYTALWLWPLVRAVRVIRRSNDPLLIGLTLSLIGWVLHGLIDFDQYIPSLAFLSFWFLGMLEARLQPSLPPQPVPVSFKIIVSCVALALACLATLRLAAVYYADHARTLSQRNPYAALQSLDKAIKLSPLDALYNADAARIEMELGRDPKTRMARARALDPYRAMYAWQASQFLRQKEGLSDAYFRAAEEAIALAPKNPRYRQALAQDYEAAGKVEKAQQHWQEYRLFRRALDPEFEAPRGS